MAFVIRNLKPAETMGEMLHNMRRDLNRTLDEMAAATKVQRRYLVAFEKDDYAALPEPIYSRHFLRAYARALRGDVNYFLSRFDAERGTCDFTDPMRLPRRKPHPLQFFVAHRLFRIGLGALCLLALTGYIGFQIQGLLKPPTIVVYEPADGTSTNDASVTVSGKTEDEAEITVNGTSVLPNADGTFSTQIVLERGLNVISIEGKTRHSRSATVYRRVVLEQAAPRSFSSLSTPMARE